jgi:hypothetical protein
MEIPWSADDKYLGVRLTITLIKYSAHVKRAAQTALGNLVHLFPLLAKDSTLSVNTNLRIYKASIRSALTYAAPVWCSISNSNYQHLQVVQNKRLHVISNSPRNTPILHLHTLLGVDYIHTYVRHLVTRYFLPNASTIPIH